MTTTFEHTRPKHRPQALAPSIREVCLIGSRARRYVHLAPEGLGAEDPGSGGNRKVEADRRSA
jgi:hypothetical protein